MFFVIIFYPWRMSFFTNAMQVGLMERIKMSKLALWAFWSSVASTFKVFDWDQFCLVFYKHLIMNTDISWVYILIGYEAWIKFFPKIFFASLFNAITVTEGECRL